MKLLLYFVGPAITWWIINKLIPRKYRVYTNVLFTLWYMLLFTALLLFGHIFFVGIAQAAITQQEKEPITLSYTEPQAPYKEGVAWRFSQGKHGGGYYDIVGGKGCGEEMVAPVDGTVVYAGPDQYIGQYALYYANTSALRPPHPTYGYHNSRLVIQDVNGGRVVMLHGEWSAHKGQTVYKGQTVIGTQDTIGHSTGCHVHYGYFIGGAAQDLSWYN